MAFATNRFKTMKTDKQNMAVRSSAAKYLTFAAADDSVLTNEFFERQPKTVKGNKP